MHRLMILGTVGMLARVSLANDSNRLLNDWTQHRASQHLQEVLKPVQVVGHQFDGVPLPDPDEK
jgi:hypothetical protein